MLFKWYIYPFNYVKDHEKQIHCSNYPCVFVFWGWGVSKIFVLIDINNLI